MGLLHWLPAGMLRRACPAPQDRRGGDCELAVALVARNRNGRGKDHRNENNKTVAPANAGTHPASVARP
ncbi:MAG: hypothetical protein ACREO3_00375, partial [Arenimonas sp.]